MGIAEFLDLGSGLLRRHASSVPNFREGMVIMSFPGRPSLLSALFPLGDLLPPGEPDLVQCIHLVLTHVFLFFGGGQLDNGIDAVAFALSTQYLFRLYCLRPVRRQSHD